MNVSNIIALLITSLSYASSFAQGNSSTIIIDDTLTNVVGMDFVYIKPGTFIMGIPDGYCGAISGKNPMHQVTIKNGFYMQTTEVTQEQWFRVTGTYPSYFKKCGTHCPVEQVSWNDVQEFVQLLNTLDATYNYRLPTEAEWEYAARAGTDGPFFFGECLSSFQANFRQTHYKNASMNRCPMGETRETPIPVGSLERNAWGLYDMHGNVAEWCQDYFGERPKLHKHVINPKGPEKGFTRVVRGGSWDSSLTNCMSGYSNQGIPSKGSYYTGFRLAMSLKLKH